MKRKLFLALLIMTILLTGCKRKMGKVIKVGDIVPIKAVHLEGATATEKAIEAFLKGKSDLNVQPQGDYALIIQFEHSVPLRDVETSLVDFTLSYSFEGKTWLEMPHTKEQGRVLLSNLNATYVKFHLPETVTTIEPLTFHYGSGYIVMEDPEMTANFYREEGWTGSDGIFSYNLTDKRRLIVFSDTFVGKVNKETDFREYWTFINNSYAYYTEKNGFEFHYRGEEHGYAETLFVPTMATGYSAWNLVTGSGLKDEFDPKTTHGTNGVNMWLSDGSEEVELIFDLMQPKKIKTIQIWNYNEVNTLYPDFLDRGVKNFELYYSDDRMQWNRYSSSLEIERGTGKSLEPSLTIDFNQTARYIRIVPKSNYGGSSFDRKSLYGLSEVAFYDEQGLKLFSTVETNSTNPLITPAEQRTIYWLQDGFVLGDKFYSLPMLIRTDTSFYVADVNLIEVPIVNGKLDIDHYTVYPTPLHVQGPTHNVVFGAGVLNQADIDGYIYIYGYIEAPNKQLVVARVHKDHVTAFDRYEFFNGKEFTEDPRDIHPIFDHVSAELSVTRLPDGKYMLTIMKDTVSGDIGYAIGDTPVGPFSDLHLIYKTDINITENTFTYNAKAHPALSKDGYLYVSYNVNTNVDKEHDLHASIYHPRFLKLIKVAETKQKEE